MHVGLGLSHNVYNNEHHGINERFLVRSVVSQRKAASTHLRSVLDNSHTTFLQLAKVGALVGKVGIG